MRITCSYVISPDAVPFKKYYLIYPLVFFVGSFFHEWYNFATQINSLNLLVISSCKLNSFSLSAVIICFWFIKSLRIFTVAYISGLASFPLCDLIHAYPITQSFIANYAPVGKTLKPL